MTPEQQARVHIDRLLAQAGWAVQNADSRNLYAGSGVALREFALESGHGSADYLLYVNRKAVGVIEAKPDGHTLAGVEVQSGKYSTGLPDTLPAYRRPLPFLYESTGVETRFTNLLDPEARSRAIFSFHTPKTLAEWMGEPERAAESLGFGQHAAANTRRLLRVPYAPPKAEGPSAPQHHRTMAGAGTGHQQPGKVLGRRSATGTGADGYRQRQDLHGL